MSATVRYLEFQEFANAGSIPRFAHKALKKIIGPIPIGRDSMRRGNDEPREIHAVARFLKVRRGQHTRVPSVPLSVSL